MDDLPSIRRAAQDGLSVMPGQVLALIKRCETAEANVAYALPALQRVDAERLELLGRVSALEAALRPFAEQEYSNPAALLTARRLLNLPDFPPIGEALAELREVVGDLFDGDDEACD